MVDLILLGNMSIFYNRKIIIYTKYFTLSDEHLNRFPVINVKNYFIIIGYNYYYDDEIINDIKRMNENSHLGKKLEKSRYIWRKQNDNQ